MFRDGMSLQVMEGCPREMVPCAVPGTGCVRQPQSAAHRGGCPLDARNCAELALLGAHDEEYDEQNEAAQQRHVQH